MKRCIVFAMLTTLTLGFRPATAATPPPDPDNDIVSFELVRDDGGGDFDLLATSNCSVTGYHIELKNAYGVVLAKVGSSNNHWCWRNGNVVSKNWGTAWCWTSAVTLWNCSDIKIEAQSKQGLPRPYVWRQWRFHLHYCLTWYCKDKFPWVYIGMRGDGTTGRNGGMG
jgi:hypothetical protein